jgi:hypothetical protein
MAAMSCGKVSPPFLWPAKMYAIFVRDVRHPRRGSARSCPKMAHIPAGAKNGSSASVFRYVLQIMRDMCFEMADVFRRFAENILIEEDTYGK